MRFLTETYKMWEREVKNKAKREVQRQRVKGDDASLPMAVEVPEHIGKTG